MFENVDDGRPDGRRMPSYTISSLMSLKAQVSLKANSIIAFHPNEFDIIHLNYAFLSHSQQAQSTVLKYFFLSL